jgi:hypothetical protein
MKKLEKNQRNDKIDQGPILLDEATLEAIRGGVNGGLNRDLIRRKA